MPITIFGFCSLCACVCHYVALHTWHCTQHCHDSSYCMHAKIMSYTNTSYKWKFLLMSVSFSLLKFLWCKNKVISTLLPTVCRFPMSAMFWYNQLSFSWEHGVKEPWYGLSSLDSAIVSECSLHIRMWKLHPLNIFHWIIMSWVVQRVARIAFYKCAYIIDLSTIVYTQHIWFIEGKACICSHNEWYRRLSSVICTALQCLSIFYVYKQFWKRKLLWHCMVSFSRQS